ncbi:Ig-like domain-containing protein [Actinoplanes oblitus]|uniref:Ig-like domain-containing protein n=1 Tax=Actinoplanes oblitus TaxID=3040509 RepID=A0ABY8WHW8_9ACTN|nr:Ig-like domain-containing protein [Actinoplanes oblitus]WIM97476.1 Ig-like domain-containing protein [Actinoplanes oblitus]
MQIEGVQPTELSQPAASRRRRVRATLVALLAGSLLFTAACSGGKSPSWQGGSDNAGGAASESPSAAPLPNTAEVTSPKAAATGVEAWSDVKYTSDDPENTTVKVTDSKGDEVKGTVDKDKHVWHPSESMDWGSKYTVTVTTPETEGKNNTVSSTFTTMKKPANLVRVTSFLGDNNTVGVGMPLIIKFGRSIPEKYRADVERKMVVTATPAQEGTWRWISPTEVHYRPKVYWKAYSKVFYKVQLKGVKMGDGWYGRSDLTVDMKIGRSFVMTVSNKTKKMTVKQDGKTINTIPVSLGKPSTPSSSGTMVVIEKKEHTVFDTTDTDPKGGYRTDIDFAQRITWSGQFIHAAPWSEGVQGRANVSHGCVNVSEAMGAWLFKRTMMGDVITVSGTEEKLKNGNGWTDWNMSYEEYKKGSYL